MWSCMLPISLIHRQNVFPPEIPVIFNHTYFFSCCLIFIFIFISYFLSSFFHSNFSSFTVRNSFNIFIFCAFSLHFLLSSLLLLPSFLFLSFTFPIPPLTTSLCYSSYSLIHAPTFCCFVAFICIFKVLPSRCSQYRYELPFPLSFSSTSFYNSYI